MTQTTQESQTPDNSRSTLKQSDADVVRVLNDLIELLIDKGVIQFTELPLEAQQKLLNRSQLRQNQHDLNLLEDEEKPLNY
jgi:hypothetical protein